MEIKITNIKGRKPLKGRTLNDFKVFLSEYSEEVVKKWIDYFVLNKKVEFERITKRLS